MVNIDFVSGRLRSQRMDSENNSQKELNGKDKEKTIKITVGTTGKVQVEAGQRCTIKIEDQKSKFDGQMIFAEYIKDFELVLTIATWHSNRNKKNEIAQQFAILISECLHD